MSMNLAPYLSENNSEKYRNRFNWVHTFSTSQDSDTTNYFLQFGVQHPNKV